MAASSQPPRYHVALVAKTGNASIDEEQDHAMIPLSTGVERNTGDALPLAMGGFSTTLLTMSLSMMSFRGVSTQNVFIGNFCFIACLALLISAQWEMRKGNTFSYTVLSAFGLFYGGYGAIMIPGLGVREAYGGLTAEYYNAMGLYILIWSVMNIFFVLASLSINVVYILMFVAIQACFTLASASYFALAEGKEMTSTKIMTAAGAFGFIASILGFYTMAGLLCSDVLPFVLPMGDTSRRFKVKV